jgi:hypothetical protein
MLFGGSQAMAGLSQQVMSAGAMMVGGAKLAGSLMYHKNATTGKKSGALIIGRNILGGIKDAMQKGASGGGGGGGSTPPPVV